MDDPVRRAPPEANAERDAEEALWVQQVAARDADSHAAWGRLFKAYRIRGIRFCRRHGLTVDDAEDLVQATMLTVYEKAGHFSFGDAARPWVMTILRNGIFDRFKKASTRHEQAVDDLAAVSDAQPLPRRSSVPQTVIDDCYRRRWAQFKAAYSEGAMALAMRAEGADIPEIAATLQRSETATRTFLSSMRKKADAALSPCNPDLPDEPA